MAQQQQWAYIAVGSLIGIAVLMIIIMLLVRGGRKRKARAWEDTAKANGLAPSGTFPLLEMHGTLDGVRVEIEHHMTTKLRRDYDNYKPQVSRWVEASASLPISTGDLTVAEEGVFAKLKKLVGAQDIQTGDPKFDKRFSVKGSNENRAREVLTAPAREALLAAESELRGEITVERGCVCWRGGTEISAERAIAILKKLASTAQAFANAKAA